eukprot:CAMPEP_0172165136 /NCGR_PEP_ID=MMETSP1050-20130122/8245_1 /TAXON_ID=233186 /ORGANISM="Cryptomonas curvata, Strain CCAP979/52" /LENGTH=417 /DNA_ID=CAMNT_0012835575 /DNA_START=39 /DNA_END=1289 /DNA_ORIENTATION=-
MIRCEVCDDTNATIHCQECRRNTCEECDEILHLVEANKSHHRIPLFSSRNGSRKGSYAPTRAASPRGTKKPEVFDSAPSTERALWPSASDAVASSSLQPVKEENVPNFENKQGMLAWPERSDVLANQINNPVASFSYHSAQPSNAVSNPGETMEYQSSDRFRQERTLERSQGNQGYQQQNQPQYHASYKPSANVPDYERAANQGGGSHRVQSISSAPTNRSQRQESAPQSPPTQSGHPTYRVNQMEPIARPYAGGSQSVRSAIQGSQPITTRQGQSQSSHPSNGARSQPLLPYNNRAPPLHGQSKSGASTPSVVMSRAQGARSVPHSGHATPTYMNSVAQRFNATGGAIPLSQWNEPTHPRRPPDRSRQSPARERERQPQAVQQQALAQHMQVIEQHRAVEAHQRMMAQKQQQQQQQ